MDLQDVERIARRALKELGALPESITIVPVPGTPGVYQIDVAGSMTLRVKCGPGSTPQWVRAQIFEQYQTKT